MLLPGQPGQAYMRKWTGTLEPGKASERMGRSRRGRMNPWIGRQRRTGRALLSGVRISSSDIKHTIHGEGRSGRPRRVVVYAIHSQWDHDTPVRSLTRRHCAGFSHSHTQKIRGLSSITHELYAAPYSHNCALSEARIIPHPSIHTRRRPSPQRFSPWALAQPRAHVTTWCVPSAGQVGGCPWVLCGGEKGAPVGAQQLHPRSPRVCRRPPSVLSVYLLENEGREGLAAVCGRGPRRWESTTLRCGA
jgi:hypothetical protein